MTSIRDKISQLGHTLPPPPKPVAAYVPAVRTGNLLFVSGQIPMLDGQVDVVGTVPTIISVREAIKAAELCVLNALAVVESALDGDLDRVTRIVRLGVFVASDPGFTDQPLVANGASELLEKIFGEAGRHARAAVGSVALPLNATVEVEMVVEVR